MNYYIKESIKRGRILILLNFFILILSVAAVAGIYNYSKLEKQAMLGQIYEADKDMSETVVNRILDNTINQNNLEHGKEAFKAAGYTENAFSYLQMNAVIKNIFILFLIIMSILLIILIHNYRILPIKFLMKENKDMEGEIEKLQKEIQCKTDFLTQKNKQLQDFTENISHQIKTPLAALSLSLDILKMKRPETIVLDDCFIQIDRIQNFITRLLKISRLESGKTVFQFDHMNLSGCLKTAAELGETKNCSFEFEMEESCNIIGDEDWLMEAFINIYNNCVAHTSGQALVRTQIYEFKDSVQIIISDNGEGIPEEGLPYIFDRFHTIENASQGHVGIGLNLSKLIIEKHKGNISACNNDMKGATFIIIIPRYHLKNGKKMNNINA